MSRRDQPPPLPHEVYERVVSLAKLDGKLVLWLSGGFALLSAAAHQGLPAIMGCVAAGAGAVELHGAHLLVMGQARGLDWVIRAQLLLLATILIYVAVSIAQFDPQLISSQITPDVEAQIRQAGMTPEQFIEVWRIMRVGIYAVVGVVAIAYQGGMARFYARRREAIEVALLDN